MLVARRVKFVSITEQVVIVVMNGDDVAERQRQADK